MKLQFRCGCGSINYNREDWKAHWKHGLHGKWRAICHFFNTRIEIVK